MKNVFKVFGIIALVAVIGFSFAACGGDDSTTGGGGTAPTITTATLPNGTVGTAYSQTLTATGDTPITWSLESGTLPTGLNLLGSGTISGTPTTANTFTFTVKATNSTGNNTKQLSITIAPSGGGDNQFVGTWTGDGLTVICTATNWSAVYPGQGSWSGPYTANGNTANFTETNGSNFGTATVSENTMTVISTYGTFHLSKDGGTSGTAPTITTVILPNGTSGTPYNQTLEATGTTPITWTLESGTLPTGLNLSTSGVITGTPSTANTFTFTVKATNAAGIITKQLSITITGESITPGTPLTVTDTASWTTAVNTIENGGNGTESSYKRYTITVNGTVSVPGYIEDAYTFGDARYIEVTLQGNGTLQLNSTGSIVSLKRNQKLIIDSANLTLKGKTANYNAVVAVNSYGGAIELKNGTITGNAGYGCGVYITGVNSNPGTFTMSGGTITGNSGEKGAVVIDTGIFTMSSGTISGNTTSYLDGGGVNLSNYSTFTMTGGTISNNNTAGSGYVGGGGVYLSGSNASFTMSGDAVISGNTASFGGGVAARNRSTFTMSGGTISGNTAKSIYGGGGLYLDSNNTYGDAVITFIKTGGSITADNTVTGSSIVGKVAYWSVLGGDVYYRDTALGTGDNVTINASTEPSSLGWTKK